MTCPTMTRSKLYHQGSNDSHHIERRSWSWQGYFHPCRPGLPKNYEKFVPPHGISQVKVHEKLLLQFVARHVAMLRPKWSWMILAEDSSQSHPQAPSRNSETFFKFFCDSQHCRQDRGLQALLSISKR